MGGELNIHKKFFQCFSTEGPCYKELSGMLQDIFSKPGSHSPDANNFPQFWGGKHIHLHIHKHIEYL